VGAFAAATVSFTVSVCPIAVDFRDMWVQCTAGAGWAGSASAFFCGAGCKNQLNQSRFTNYVAVGMVTDTDKHGLTRKATALQRPREFSILSNTKGAEA